MGVTLPDGFRTKITLAQQVEASDRWNSNPYLHHGSGPAMAPPIREAVQILRAPWLCGVSFQEDEEGEVVAVTAEKKLSSLNNQRRVRWLLQNNFKGYRLLPKAELFVDTHLCAHKSEFRVQPRIPQRKSGNPFARRAAADWWSYDLQRIQDTLVDEVAATALSTVQCC
jgi:hypothetical protein